MASLNGTKVEERVLQPHLRWPPDILTGVLQLVPQQQRLNSCALVSHAWHAAAVAATSNIRICGTTSDSLYGWLELHGPVLRSITATRGSELSSGNTQPAQILRLPFERLVALQSLEVSFIDRLARGKSSMAAVGDLTALTALSLNGIKTCHLSDAVGCMSRMQNLKDLHLSEVWQPEENWQFVATSLSQLTQLTHLGLSAWPRQQNYVEGLYLGGGFRVPSLTNLQQMLRLSLTGHLDFVALPELPESITRLMLISIETEMPSLQLTTLWQLGSLTSLYLGNFTVDIEEAETVLLQLTKLRQLGLMWINDTSPRGLKTLTKLTQLSALKLFKYQLQGVPRVDDKDKCHTLSFTSQANPPDVHLQLKAYCNGMGG